ncbi:amphi-Trp domain-containing protein [Streptomyces sp. NPDC006385]|uniref:amphi-Trp domain-containing protein n=1 Tax=Streptomyces sp. NPDC006385 TaxID=3156761 RepID=UPI0033ACD0FB
MTDLKLEQERSLSRLEAAEQLEALAAALRQGGEAELELDPWKLSLRIPGELRSEIEVEVSDGEIELEIELKWPTGPATRAAPSVEAETDAAKAGGGRKGGSAPAAGRTRASGGRAAKRTTAKKS